MTNEEIGALIVEWRGQTSCAVRVAGSIPNLKNKIYLGFLVIFLLLSKYLNAFHEKSKEKASKKKCQQRAKRASIAALRAHLFFFIKTSPPKARQSLIQPNAQTQVDARKRDSSRSLRFLHTPRNAACWKVYRFQRHKKRCFCVVFVSRAPWQMKSNIFSSELLSRELDCEKKSSWNPRVLPVRFVEARKTEVRLFCVWRLSFDGRMIKSHRWTPTQLFASQNKQAK